jgi:hypothetical protein
VQVTNHYAWRQTLREAPDSSTDPHRYAEPQPISPTYEQPHLELAHDGGDVEYEEPVRMQLMTSGEQEYELPVSHNPEYVATATDDAVYEPVKLVPAADSIAVGEYEEPVAQNPFYFASPGVAPRVGSATDDDGSADPIPVYAVVKKDLPPRAGGDNDDSSDPIPVYSVVKKDPPPPAPRRSKKTLEEEDMVMADYAGAGAGLYEEPVTENSEYQYARQQIKDDNGKIPVSGVENDALVFV